MSRAIKVEDHVYQDLADLKEKGQTFSQVIEWMIETRNKIMELLSVIEGQAKFHEFREKEIKRLREEASSREK